MEKPYNRNNAVSLTEDGYVDMRKIPTPGMQMLFNQNFQRAQKIRVSTTQLPRTRFNSTGNDSCAVEMDEEEDYVLMGPAPRMGPKKRAVSAFIISNPVARDLNNPNYRRQSHYVNLRHSYPNFNTQNVSSTRSRMRRIFDFLLGKNKNAKNINNVKNKKVRNRISYISFKETLFRRK